MVYTKADSVKIRELVNNGESIWSIWEEYGTRGLKVAETALRRKKVPDNIYRKVYWYWGPTGSGKTRTAYKHKGIVNAEMRGKWFRLYRGEKAIVFDNIYRRTYKCVDLIHYISRECRTVPTDIGSVPALYEEVIITSLYHPEDLYRVADSEDMYQEIYLKRLLSLITEIVPFGDAKRRSEY